jgi:hypothetical protein
MNKIMLKLALLAVLFATPVALAQQGRGGVAGNVQQVTQTLDGMTQAEITEAVQQGLINVRVQQVSVNALNNVNVNVQLTRLLRNVNVLTDSQVAVAVLTFGDQIVVRAFEAR